MNWTRIFFPVLAGVTVALLQLSILTSVLNIHASAALAGFWQSKAEYERIFNDPRLLDGLNGHLMTSVRQDGYTIIIEAENDCVIRGSIRDGPEVLKKGYTGGRIFHVADLKVDRGCEDEVPSPSNCESTSISRLQDFRNLLKKLGETHYGILRTMRIDQIEILGTNTFRISSSNSYAGFLHADIPFTPSGCVTTEDHHSML